MRVFILFFCFFSGATLYVHAQTACGYYGNPYYTKTDTSYSCDTCRVNFNVISGNFSISIHIENYFDYLREQKNTYDSLEFFAAQGERCWSGKKDSMLLFEERALFRKQYNLIFKHVKSKEALKLSDIPPIRDVYYRYDFLDFLCSEIAYGSATITSLKSNKIVPSLIFKEIRKKGNGKDVFFTFSGDKVIEHKKPDHIQF